MQRVSTPCTTPNKIAYLTFTILPFTVRTGDPIRILFRFGIEDFSLGKIHPAARFMATEHEVFNMR